MKPFLISLSLILLVAFTGNGQIRDVTIGVNGLTCSMCTRNVELQLRKLPFVSGVTMNLEHTNGVIHIKPDASFTPEAIAKSVKDAGFSLRYLKINVAHPEQYNVAGGCFTISGLAFQLVPGTGAPSADLLTLQLLGEPFQPKKEYRQSVKRTCTINTKVYFVASSNG